ncbi:MAG TPA: helix-turn-helix domain-containing protein [Propionibacteriaceae bacterium]
MSPLGRLLRRHREQARLTQEELADRAGVSARTISDIERGVRARAYADTAARLSVALGLTETDRAAFLNAARGPNRMAGYRGSSVPRPITPLIGREREVSQLVTALDAEERRLVTITGLGGVGKTRLAFAVAAELEVPFEGRVYYLPIPPNQDVRLLISAVARSLGFPERGSPADLAEDLAGRRTLVVLDPLEHVMAAVADLEAVLAAAPELRILAASRVCLHVAGEYELALEPLPVPTVSQAEWFRVPAARLFLERVRELRPDLEVHPEIVVDICRRVSGLPLALELAAARIRHFPPTVLRDRLAENIGDLTSGKQDPSGRYRSLEQTLAWSTESLSADEALVLAIAALFPGGLRLDAAGAMCGPGLDVVASVSTLVDKSLLFLDTSSEELSVPRWRMLDVIRQFVQGSTAVVESGLRAGFLQFYLRLLAELAGEVGREEWFGQLAAEDANLKTALTWAAEDRDAETLLGLCGGLWQFWQTRGELTEGRRWLETGLSVRPAASDATTMTALWGLGWLAYHQADEAAAADAAVRLAELAERHQDDRARRNALTLRGMVAIARDRGTEAVDLLQDALSMARRVGERWLLATSKLNLGLAYLCLGNTDRARAGIGEALRAYEEIGDQRFHARCLAYLGHAALIDQDPDRASALIRNSLTAFRDLAEPGGTAEGLVGLAAIQALQGNTTRAALLAGAAERLRDSYAGRQLPLDERISGRHLAVAQTILGPEEWSRAWAKGRELQLDSAIDLALRCDP